MGGNTPSVGMVELYTHRQWLPLCWTGFGWGQANAVCRQLGYTEAASFRCVCMCVCVYFRRKRASFGIIGFFSHYIRPENGRVSGSLVPRLHPFASGDY